MSLPIPVPTSRKNAIASFAYWVQQNVLPYMPTNGLSQAFKLEQSSWENTEAYPNITITERGMPDIGPLAFNDTVGQANNATMRQTLLEINIQDRLADGNESVRQTIRLAREVLWQTLYYSGQSDSTGATLAPSIPILNFDDSNTPHSATDGFVWWPDEETNTWFETEYFSSSSDPNLKRIQIMLRIRWFEFRN